ncbi:MAG: ABC transporter permease [Deltaproteobacteria bacterium]|nr:MAG: ABC transporter permease [Deltaproteobacteria bacterium]
MTVRALWKAWAFVWKDLLTDISYRVAFLGQLVFVMFLVGAFYFLGETFKGAQVPALQRYGGQYFPFVLVGVAFSSYLGVAVRSFADTIRSAQVLGTLEALLATPTPAGQIVVFSSLYAFLATSMRVVLILLAGALFFGVDFGRANWAGAVLALVLTVLSFSSLGILSAAVVLAFKRADPSAWIVQGFSYLLGGVYYPVSVLPGWGKALANLLPITHSLEAMRMLLLRGASVEEVAGSLVALVVFLLIAGPLSMLAFLWALRRGRRDGSLSHF